MNTVGTETHSPRRKVQDASAIGLSLAMRHSDSQGAGGNHQEVVFMAPETLTPREREVLDLHDANMRNVDIASQLGIAAGTVSNALVKALKKVGRESEIGGNGGGGTRQPAGAANDPEEMFKREGAKVLRRAQDSRDAVENFPADFEEWMTNNREALEKQYDADRERLTSQLVTAQQAEDNWVTFAEKLDIDLTEVAAAAMGDEAKADADAEATTEDDSETDEDEDNAEESA